jgi:hypothetical protein
MTRCRRFSRRGAEEADMTVRMRMPAPLFAVAILTALIAVPGTAAATPDTGRCYDGTAPVTYEETRIETPAEPGGVRVPYHLVEAGGFAPFVDGLAAALCQARSVDAARAVLERHGARLWRAAVERAQGTRTMGTIDAYDDRPVYWARLTGTRDLRRWRPAFAVSDTQRAALVKAYEYASRGISSTDRPAPAGVTRVLVSGFDPFQLNGEIRRSNPSGAAALQLDGRQFEVGGRTVRVESVVFPVTWSAFDAGYVEDAFGPRLTAGSPARADLIMTISQGRRGAMDVEQWAGAWRGGYPDNNDTGTPEPVPSAPGWPRPDPQPEFIETTLPYRQMIAAGTAPFPVRLNPGVCEWAGGGRPDPAAVTCTDDGPTPGSQADSGGGGNYLSNESMYRSNRLRGALGAHDVPGGHLHISALTYPTDPTVVLDAAFAADRAQTVDQTVALVRAAGAAVR